MVYIWAFLASIGIMFLEYIYHNVKITSFWSILYITILPIVGSQFCLYKMFQEGKTIWIAAIAFTLINALLRVVNTLLYGEPLSWQVVCGIICMLIGSIVISLK
jgi:drug/metabolite transporter (DMT)-like permease